MKYTLINLALVILPTICYCQGDLGFQKGVIITQKQDTISCLVPIASSFGEKIETKKNKDSKIEVILLENIKYLVTEFNVYEHITFKKKEDELHKLMWIEIEGKLNLYLELEMTTFGPSRKENNLTITNPREPGRTYVIKKAGITYLVGEKKDFIESVKLLIADAPELLAKVEAKKYTYNNIEELVKEYNRLAVDH